MKSQNLTHRLWGALLVSLLAISVALPAAAKDNPSDHPLKILKARFQNDQSRGGSMSSRGNLTIWIKNTAGLTVDGIEIEVQLMNDRRRVVETLRRKIDKLDAGEKKVLTFRWDVIAERDVKPKFFVEYLVRGKQKARFQGETPSSQ